MKRLLITGLLIALAAATGCSDSNSNGFILPGLTASFNGSGTAAAANLVRLEGSTAGDTVNVRVVIDGATTNTDLYSFAFDLVLSDGTLAQFVSGTTSFGNALTTSGGQTSQVLAVQNGDRITVGVSKLGGGAGNAVPAGERTVVSMDLRLLKVGTGTLRIEGSPPNAPAVLDSTGAVIGTVLFDGATAAIGGT